MPRWKLALVVALAAALAAPAARAIDLTGTWTAAKGLKCTLHTPAEAGFHEDDSNLATILLKQTGTDLWIEINPGPDTSYENKLKGSALTSPKSDAQGYAAATACSIDGEYYSGSFVLTKAKTDGSGGSFSLIFQGLKFGNVISCKGRYERTSAADPGFATTCP